MTVASPDPRNILGHVPGRLCVAPTDLSTAYPHGGVDLGEMGQCAWGVDAPVKLITYEEFGAQVQDVVHGGHATALVFTLRELNLRAYQEFWPNAAAGGTSGHPVLRGGSDQTVRAGYLYGNRAKVFVFSPEDVDNHPFVVFYQGIPVPTDSFDVKLSDADAARWGVPCVLYAARNSSGRAYEVGRRDDVSLS